MAVRANYSTSPLNSPYFKIPNGALYNPQPSTASFGALGAFGGRVPAAPSAGNKFGTFMPTPPIQASDGRNTYVTNLSMQSVANTRAFMNKLNPQAIDNRNATNYNRTQSMDNRNAMAGNNVVLSPQLQMAQNSLMRSRGTNVSRTNQAASSTGLGVAGAGGANREARGNMGAAGGGVGGGIDRSTKWSRRAAGFDQGPGEEKQVVAGTWRLNPIAEMSISWRTAAG